MSLEEVDVGDFADDDSQLKNTFQQKTGCGSTRIEGWKPGRPPQARGPYEYTTALVTKDNSGTGEVRIFSGNDNVRTYETKSQKRSTMEDKPAVNRRVLFHFLADLRDFHSAANDMPGLDHLSLLIDHLNSTYASVLAHRDTLLKTEEITFDLLWTIFKPNSIIYTYCLGTRQPRCIKLDFGKERESKQHGKYFRVEGRYLDFDGQVFGESRFAVAIQRFQGVKSINQLMAFPLQYHPEPERAKARLIERGKKFVQLIGIHHRQCQGSAFYMHRGEPVQVNVRGRITIDAAFFRQRNSNYAGPSIDKSEKGSLDLDFIYSATSEKAEEVTNSGLDPRALDEEGLLICSPTVFGFSFSDKMWLEFATVGIQNIRWDTSAFDKLVLLDDHKELVLALAESQTSDVASFDDIIEGKGYGLNMLLHGPPGVGKTLTAEVLSEHLQRPLYSISAGELGTDPGRLEIRLGEIFELGCRWGTPLLLDEADVYMEQRTTENVVRHTLVSGFLRKMEYFRGILILTTNRVETFDEAILSRVHLKLRYGALNEDARVAIWKLFVEKAITPAGPAQLGEQDLQPIARKSLNGRQIKNNVSTCVST